MGLLTGIVNTVVGGAESLWRSTFGQGSHMYPSNIAELVTNINAEESGRAWQSSLGYSFKVVRVDPEGKWDDASGWQEFVFQINPQDITQDEIFAIQVTPTFAGVMVEHQGITLKDVLISGTTGISPGRREGGAYPNTGAPVAGGGRSGYYEFHELRSYIRTYAEAKRNDKSGDANELRLVWRNFKDKEDLFVEPQKFTMRRSSTKPFSYDYSIQLKAIGVAKIKSKDGGWLEAIDKAVQGIQDTMDSCVKILDGSLGMLEQIDRDIRNTLIAPLKTVQSFVTSFKRAGFRLHNIETAKKVSRAYCKDVLSALENTFDNGHDSINREANQEYLRLKGKSSTTSTSAEGTTIPMALYSDYKTMNALKQLQGSMYQMISKNVFFESTIEGLSKSTVNIYNSANSNKIKSANVSQKSSLQTQMDQALLRGDIKTATSLRTQLDNLTRSESRRRTSTNNVTFINAKYTTTKIVESGHTIQTIAIQHLKNIDAYRDLILINNLIYPYVSSVFVDEADKVVGVLYPGDKIYIPQAGSPGSPTSVGNSSGYPITYGQDLVELQYGVDIKLTEDFDIALDVTGDAKLVSGQSNVAQALLLKLLYERGSLKRHPGIGTRIQIGSKGTDTRQTLQDVRQSLLTDSRLDAILFSEITQESSAISMNFILRLIGADQPVAFPVRLQE